MQKEQKTIKQTTIINLFGGPGSGKSTIAAGLLYYGKLLGKNIELAAEYAKELAYSGVTPGSDLQITIFTEQKRREINLLGKVDYIVSDCPVMLSGVYEKKVGNLSEYGQISKIIQQYEREKIESNYRSINIFINRPLTYETVGTYQNLEEAKELDKLIMEYLYDHKFTYHVVPAIGEDTIVPILKDILRWKE